MSDATLVLHKFMPAWGQPDMSPFCAKVEAYLRMAGIPYAVRVADSRKTPRQKLPVAEIGGKLIPDSSQIIDYLEAQRREPLDAHLNPRDRALTTAVKNMLEEHFYYVLVYMRWQDENGWAVNRTMVEAHQAELGRPAPFGALMALLARGYMKTTLHRQGMGRYPRDEVIAIGKSHLQSVADLMSDGAFFFGDAPSTLDATIYAMVGNLLGSTYDCPVRDFALTLGNLRSFCERLDERYFSLQHEAFETESVNLRDPQFGRA